MTVISKSYDCGFAKVSFFSLGNALNVEIETLNLDIKSIEDDEIESCMKLYKNSKNPPTFGKVTNKVNVWVKKWMTGDLWSVFAVTVKGSSEFVGYIGLKSRGVDKYKLFGHGYTKLWEKYGLEATIAVADIYMHTVYEKVRKQPHDFTIWAETEEKNQNSNKILVNAGMKLKISENSRNFYTMSFKKVGS